MVLKIIEIIGDGDMFMVLEAVIMMELILLDVDDDGDDDDTGHDTFNFKMKIMNHKNYLNVT